MGYTHLWLDMWVALTCGECAMSSLHFHHWCMDTCSGQHRAVLTMSKETKTPTKEKPSKVEMKSKWVNIKRK
jgi:hypothetical protein